MAEFKLVISDPKDGKAYQKEISGSEANSIVGAKIGDQIDGSKVGLSGYTLELTGGSDTDGIPMRSDLSTPERKKLMISGGQGFNPKSKGIRRKKSVRGNEISDKIIQVNAKVIDRGEKELEDLIKG